MRKEFQIRRFAERARLEELALDRCAMSVNRSTAGRSAILRMESSINTASDDDGQLTYVANCGCMITGVADDEEKPVLEQKVDYVVRYVCAERFEWSNDELNFFASCNVILHVWPYRREFIDQLTRQANLPRVLLPLVPRAAVPRKVDSQ